MVKSLLADCKQQQNQSSSMFCLYVDEVGESLSRGAHIVGTIAKQAGGTFPHRRISKGLLLQIWWCRTATNCEIDLCSISTLPHLKRGQTLWLPARFDTADEGHPVKLMLGCLQRFWRPCGSSAAAHGRFRWQHGEYLCCAISHKCPAGQICIPWILPSKC